MMSGDIHAKLDNLIQITETSNKTLDIIIDRQVVKESGSIVPPKVTPVVKGFSDIISENFPNKLQRYVTPHMLLSLVQTNSHSKRNKF